MSPLNEVAWIDELQLEGRRVLLRVDFDVPLDSRTREVVDDQQIRAALPTVRSAMEAGARVILATHLGQPQGQRSERLSLDSVGQKLAELADCEVFLPDECAGQAAKKVIAELRAGQVCLLENLRFCAGEEQADETLAQALAALIDDAERRNALGATGQHRMQKEFSIATMADQHVNLYETILNG